MIKTIVIGAGVMGASVAYRLAQAGAAVTVLEATRIGGGTSGISFAWTNAHKKPPKPYHDLNVAGMKAHAALADEFGATPWWHGGGSLEWEAEPDRAAQREDIEQLRSWGYAAEWITSRQVQELEPDLDPATIGDAPVAFFPEEGWLDPVVYAHAMLSALGSPMSRFNDGGDLSRYPCNKSSARTSMELLDSPVRRPTSAQPGVL
jgi:glycine/D-amino acid oxidase-like deaminating enzyme